MTTFEWDEDKRQTNFNRHGIDFRKACQIFENDTIDFIDNRYNYREDRFVAIGQVEGQILTVIYTWRSNTIRLISARKATKNERKIYYQGDN